MRITHARRFSWINWTCLVFLVGLAHSANAKPTEPSLVLRIKSIEAVLTDFRYLAKLLGQEQAIQRLDQLLKEAAGAGQAGKQGARPEDIPGVDVKRPVALYGIPGPNLIDGFAVLMVPVTDAQALLKHLNKLNLKIDQDKSGLYTGTLAAGGDPCYFRFAHQYAYITIRNADALAPDNLLLPALVFPPGHMGTITVAARIDHIPDEIKKIIIGQLDLYLADLKEVKEKGETAAQHAFRIQFLREVGQHLAAALTDGSELILKFDVDHKTGTVTLELNLTPKLNSSLATTIARLNNTQSVVAGLLSRDAAMSGRMRLTLPPGLSQLLDPAVEDTLHRVLHQEKDKIRRNQTEKFFKLLAPELKHEEIDWAMEIRGPTKTKVYTLVGGLRLKDGVAFEKGLRALVQDLPASERAKVKLDLMKHDKIAIHQFEMSDVDQETRRTFGDHPAYLAIRPNAAFLTMGEDALKTLKDIIQVQPIAGKPFQFRASFARLILTKEQQVAAQEAFGNDQEQGRMNLVVEGGKSLKVRLVAKIAVLKFMSLLSGLKPDRGK